MVDRGLVRPAFFARAINLCAALVAGWLLQSLQPVQSAEPQRNLVPIPTSAKRVALVIGNSAYPDFPLKNPVNDARDMAATLRALGFDVIEKSNANQREMNRAISQFGSKLTADSIAIFYFSGHGIQARGKNFIVPVDASITSEGMVRTEAVDVDSVLDQISTSQVNILILDACRNNPFERGFRGAGGGLAPMDAPKGTLIAYATAPGRTAADGDGANSPYTAELVQSLKVSGLSIEQIFKRVRNGVAKRTADRQIPWEASSLTGEFYIAGEPNSTPQAGVDTTIASIAPPKMARSEEDKDDEYWAAISMSQRRSDLIDYLFRYPSGRHSEAAASLAEGRWIFDKLTRCAIFADSVAASLRWDGQCVDGKANGRGSIAVELGDRSIKGQRHILAGLDDGPCSTSINKDGRPAFRTDGSCKAYASGPISWSFDGKREILDASGAVTDSYQGRLTKAWKGAEEFNGEITYASGVVFKGTVNGSTSKGTMTFKAGNSTRCTFVRAIANGSGCEQKNANGKGSYVGDLKDGKRNGFGRLTYEDGGGYEGNFQDNQFSGNGALTFASGAKVIGNFAVGKPDGVVVHVDKDGQRTSQTFVAGQRVK